jgi:hypothetical protein
VEDIISWNYDDDNNLVAVLLCDHNYEIDENTQLVTGEKSSYRLLQKTVEGVVVTSYDNEGKRQEQVILNLVSIPFVMLEISQSLMTDIADYQIALTNMASSDTAFSLYSNFPFYTEQFDPKSVLAGLMKTGTQPTESSEAGTNALQNKAGNATIKVGTTHGRRYPINTERPGYINPSAEPLQASMAKQEVMKHEIRQLLNLSLSNLAPRRASSDSKEVDERGKEAGLAIIAFELEACEREIAKIWNNYEGSNEEAIVNYPQQYSLKTETERRSEAKEKLDEIPRIPSLTFQRILCKQAITLLLGTQVSDDELQQIMKEIDGAQVISINPDVIVKTHEAGLICDQTASQALLYPKGDWLRASEDHAKRLARIAIAQTEGAAAARGIDSTNKQGAKDEKLLSQRADVSDGGTPSVRGEGK